MLPDPGAPVSPRRPRRRRPRRRRPSPRRWPTPEAGLVRALDLTGPEALRPFVVAGLVRDGPHGAGGHRDRPRGRGPRRGARRPASTRRASRYYPSWETLPHERLSPRSDTVGRRLAVLRRLCHPGADATNGPLRVVVAPVRSVLQPQVKGLGDLEPVELAPGDERAARGRRTPAGRRGVHPRRPGREARRVRGPRRHRRRLPADRGAPAAGGVLGRRRRGDPHLRGRRPAHAREGRAAVGAAVPRAAAHRRGPRAAPASWASAHPAAASSCTDKIAAGIAVEGMESLAPVLVDEMELLVDLLPADTHVLVLDPERVRARAHDLVATSEEFLGASWAAAAGGGTAPIDLGAASYRALGDVRAHALGARPGVVDAVAVRARRRRTCRASRSATSSARSCRSTSTCRSARCRRGRCRRSRPTPTAATSSARSPTSRGWLRRGLPRRRRAPRATARPSGWSRCSASTTSPARLVDDARRRAATPTSSPVTCGALDHGFVDDGQPARRAHRRGPLRPEGLDPRHAQDAGPPQAADRPARADGRRLRRARAARRRPVRRDEAARGRTARRASTSSSSTAPPSAAARPTGSTCRPTRSTR